MSGYDFDFVDDIPDRLLCQICQLPCRDPQRSVSCVHVFCKAELRTSRGTSNEQLEMKECPVCREKTFTTFLDKALQREINAKSFYCPNKKEGCGWVGKIARVDVDLKSHLDTECPCYCPYCDITAEREVISSEHKEKCHKFPITCPNNCGLGNIPRDCMEEHKKVCPLEVVQCEYGCGAVMARNKTMEHDRERFLTHIRIFKSELDRSIQKTSSANRCTKAERKVASLLLSVIEKLDASEVKFKPINYNMDSSSCIKSKVHKSFKCFLPTLLQYSIKILLSFDWLLIHLLLLLNLQKLYWKHKATNGVSSWPVLTEMDERLSFTLTDLVFNYGFKKHPPPDSGLEYLLDYWRNLLGIKLTAPVYLEMPDFNKHTITNTEWYSTPFFAYKGGYVMRLKAYTAGTDDGKGTRLAVYLHLMKGPYDNKLKWPPRGQFSIELIDLTNQTFMIYPDNKTLNFDGRFADYNRVSARKMSNYGLGYAEFIDSYNSSISNLIVVDSFLTRRNSLFFMISYYNK